MTPEVAIAVVAVFAAVAVGSAYVVSLALERTSPARRRLREVTTGPAAPGSVSAVTASPSRLVDDVDERLARATKLFGKSPKEMGRKRRQLAKAGYYGVWPVVVYAASELLLPVILAAVVIWLFGWGQGLIFAAIGAIVGYLLPGFVLGVLVNKRRKGIQNGLPDGLDLIIVCVEAGMGLDQAVAKSGDELAITHPALAEELRAITTEIRAGKPRLEAFRNFAERTQLDDAKALVAMLVQTDRFGTSVAEALRVLADEMRTKRRQRAEERAQKLGVKLVFPLVFFLFPALYVVLLGPAFIRFARFFGSR
jgi:tight adherence protein C